MATDLDSSHRGFGGKKCCQHSSAFIFDWILMIFLQVTSISITSKTSSKFGQIGPRTAELAALDLKNPHESKCHAIQITESDTMFKQNEPKYHTM